MKLKSLSVLLVCLACATAQAQDPIVPDSLLNWLRLIEQDDFQTLNAADQNGFYFAVKIDEDGDILFASHEHRENAKSERLFSTRVQTLEGDELFDSDSKKRNPESIKVTYKSELRGIVKVRSSITVAYSPGMIYPLKKRDQKSIRVQYVEDLGDNKKNVLFNHVVILPQKGDG